MKILVDTQCFLWFFLEPHKLGEEAQEILTNPNHELFLSAASAWEISIKYSLGKLTIPEPPEIYVPKKLLSAQITGIPIDFSHVLSIHSLPLLHKDPFDRLLIAQAKVESFTLLTADPIILQYDITCIWGGLGNSPQDLPMNTPSESPS